MLKLLERARERQVGVPALRSTDYINTIPPEREPWFPGDEDIERRIRAYIRWNAAIMVSRANKTVGVGGHIATYASAASLYEVGLQPLLPRQGPRHAAWATRSTSRATPRRASTPAPSSRAGSPRQHLDGFRQEKSHAPYGLSSYPHPRLMPEFWEFPTVSMGLGPIGAIYQARFNRYLHARGLADTSNSHVWAFLGDGEMDEVESLGAIGVAAREELDNLTFVINCNLQRLDGPVRGNGKIIQELESYFRGAGWNVIKVVWGRDWDPLLARDGDGVLVNQMNTTPDGQFQTYTVESGAYIRDHFFGGDPRLRKMVEDMTDDDLRQLSPRRPRLPQGVRGVPGGARARRPADGDPGQDDQGLDARVLRGPQRHAPDEEADQGRPQGLPRPALPADHRRGARGRPAAVLPPGREVRRDPVHEGAAGRARRRAAQAGGAGQAAARCPATRPTPSCARGQASSRSRRRWPPSGCSRT